MSRKDVKNVDESVRHPSHYKKGGWQVIDVIENWDLGYHVGNVVKYVLRSPYKHDDAGEKDIRKAIWYLVRYLNYAQRVSNMDIADMLRNLANDYEEAHEGKKVLDNDPPEDYT